jgi:hypothetical protein
MQETGEIDGLPVADSGMSPTHAEKRAALGEIEVEIISKIKYRINI